MNETTVKTCVSCKHFGGPDAEVYGIPRTPVGPECKHPGAVSRDMIFGKAYCQSERQTNKGCGKQGKLWVSKS